MSHLSSVMAGLSSIEDTYSDCTIQIDEEETFSAHRIVLHLHSPLLRTILNQKAQDGKEGEATTIDLRDNDPAALRAMLHFFYHGSYDIPGQLSPLMFHVAVFQIADTYEATGLKSFARESFTDILAKETWTPDRLVAAAFKLEAIKTTVRGADKLRKDLIVAVSKRSRGLYNNLAFKSFIQDHPEWVIELLKIYGQKGRSSGQGGWDLNGVSGGDEYDENYNENGGGESAIECGGFGTSESSGGRILGEFPGPGKLLGYSEHRDSDFVYGKDGPKPPSKEFEAWSKATSKMGSSKPWNDGS